MNEAPAEYPNRGHGARFSAGKIATGPRHRPSIRVESGETGEETMGISQFRGIRNLVNNI